MRVFHGTIQRYADRIMTEGILLGCSKKFLDFGRGFYTTPSLLLAIKTAKLRTDKYNSYRGYENQAKPCVVELTFDESAIAGLNRMVFHSPSEEWKNFVLANRIEIEEQRTNIQHNFDARFDYVQGPTADGTPTIASIVEELNQGRKMISDIEVARLLSQTGKDLGEQISFHTIRGISCLTIMGCATINE